MDHPHPDGAVHGHQRADLQRLRPRRCAEDDDRGEDDGEQGQSPVIGRQPWSIHRHQAGKRGVQVDQVKDQARQRERRYERRVQARESRGSWDDGRRDEERERADDQGERGRLEKPVCDLKGQAQADGRHRAPRREPARVLDLLGAAGRRRLRRIHCGILTYD